MLKRISIRKLLVASSALFALFLIYLIPRDHLYSLQDKIPQSLEYVNKEVITSPIFLFDQHEMLARSEVVVVSNAKDIEARARELATILIKEGALESKIPSGFKAVLPSDTKILSLSFDQGLLKINFSKEFLDTKEELEEKQVSALIYSLTSIPEVKNVILYVNGDVLGLLPKSKIALPGILNRDFGINKSFEIKSTKEIKQVTIYYVSKYNDQTYYVPVTKYVNDARDKIKIVIDDLTSSHLYNSNLMSYLNSNAKLLKVEQTNDLLDLTFNSYLFHDLDEKDILEEVIYSICLSVADNYPVSEVIFQVGEEQVYKSVLKELE